MGLAPVRVLLKEPFGIPTSLLGLLLRFDILLGNLNLKGAKVTVFLQQSLELFTLARTGSRKVALFGHNRVKMSELT